MHPTLCLACAAAISVCSSTSALAAPAQLEAIIWATGKTSAEAARSMKAWPRERSLSETVIELPQGFPMVVDGDTIPGLTPGTHVIVLGFCNAVDSAALLPVVKALTPSIDRKPVTLDADREACPTIPSNAKVTHVETVSAAGTSLTLVQLDGTWPTRTTTLGKVTDQTHVVAAVRDRKGTLGAFSYFQRIASVVPIAGAPRQCRGQIAKVGKALVVSETCQAREQTATCKDVQTIEARKLVLKGSKVVVQNLADERVETPCRP